jgi:hypothetical protein
VLHPSQERLGPLELIGNEYPAVDARLKMSLCFRATTGRKAFDAQGEVRSHQVRSQRTCPLEQFVCPYPSRHELDDAFAQPRVVEFVRVI